MRKFKSGRSYFLDKSEYSSTTANVLYDKLVKDFGEGYSSLAKVSLDSKTMTVTVKSSNLEEMSKLVKEDRSVMQLDMDAIRKTFLNLRFDKDLKTLVLTSDNVENFNKFNTVEYEIKCSVDPESRNSLFFHESALANYTIDIDESTWQENPYYLMLVTFDRQTIVNDIVASSKDFMFLCYNSVEKKIENVMFPIVNAGIPNQIVSMFISNYNSDAHNPNFTLTVSESQARVDICSNFKMAVSMFKLLGKNENEFVSFKTFVASSIYNQFIENLKLKLGQLKWD